MTLLIVAYAVVAFVVNGVYVYRAVEKQGDCRWLCVEETMGWMLGIFWPIVLVLLAPWWAALGLSSVFRFVKRGLAEMKKPPLNSHPTAREELEETLDEVRAALSPNSCVCALCRAARLRREAADDAAVYRATGDRGAER